MDPQTDLLDRPDELGRRLAAAIAYSPEKQSEIAKRLAFDERTLRNYYDGGLESKSRAQREAVVREVERETECPAELFGLSPSLAPIAELEGRLRKLEKAVGPGIELGYQLTEDVGRLDGQIAEVRETLERIVRGQEDSGT